MSKEKSKYIPGMERFQLPFEERAYRGYFNDAFKILSHSAMPESVRTLAEQLAVDYATSRMVSFSDTESKIQNMARRILETGDAIIITRGWSNVPDKESQNFAWQLKGDSENAQSLWRMATTINSPDLAVIVAKKLQSHRIKSIARFSDVPDLRLGASPEQSDRELMQDLSLDFAIRLGFIPCGTSFLPRIKGSRNGRSMSFDILHPSMSFKLDFSSYPGIHSLNINLYHWEQVRK